MRLLQTVFFSCLGFVVGAMFTLNFTTQRDSFQSNADSISAAVSEISTQLSALNDRLIYVEKNLPVDRISHENAANSGQGDLLLSLEQRINLLENSIDQHQSTAPQLENSSTIEISRSFDRPHPIASHEYQGNSQGEELLLGDGGSSLGFDAASIYEIAESSSDSLTGVKDADCRGSTCKITLAAPRSDFEDRSGQYDNSTQELISELSEKHEGDNLEFYYGRDEEGNQVMYVHAP